MHEAMPTGNAGVSRGASRDVSCWLTPRLMYCHHTIVHSRPFSAQGRLSQTIPQFHCPPPRINRRWVYACHRVAELLHIVSLSGDARHLPIIVSRGGSGGLPQFISGGSDLWDRHACEEQRTWINHGSWPRTHPVGLDWDLYRLALFIAAWRATITNNETGPEPRKILPWKPFAQVNAPAKSQRGRGPVWFPIRPPTACGVSAG